MSDVVAWLESAEGERWHAQAIEAAFVDLIAMLYPADCFSTGLGEASDCVVNPAHDPCGRPPMPP